MTREELQLELMSGSDNSQKLIITALVIICVVLFFLIRTGYEC